VVVTFGFEGAYGHPDHIAISQFATAAVTAAADGSYRDPEDRSPHRVPKLYWVAWDHGELERYQMAFKRLLSHVDGVEREATAWPDWAITTRVDTRRYWPTVWRAIQCHGTQLPGYGGLAGLSDADQERLWGNPGFYRVMSTVNGGRELETDLFAGLRTEALELES
jgi:LmbE family N-acetylglucosaminyl deacetylase